mgnify:FL=1
MFVYFSTADGNHYLIETSDDTGEAVLGMDYAEPGCIEERTTFSVSCVREGCMKIHFFCTF